MLVLFLFDTVIEKYNQIPFKTMFRIFYYGLTAMDPGIVITASN